MQTIDAQALHLPPELLKSLEQGVTLALMDSDATLAFLVPALPANSKRPFGLAKGEFTVPKGFNEPLPDLETEIYGE